MAAPEAVLVVGDPVSGEQVHNVDGLVACRALVLSPAERHCVVEDESKELRIKIGPPFFSVSRQKAKLGIN